MDCFLNGLVNSIDYSMGINGNKWEKRIRVEATGIIKIKISKLSC